MIVKTIETEWFQDYKKPSMYIAFPTCSFKCEKECGKKMCQNSHITTLPEREVDAGTVIQKYISNTITQAIVCGGLEPMDSFDELYSFIHTLRYEYRCNDDVVIYTGYTAAECNKNDWVKKLLPFGNIVIKFGRYIPNQKPHYDMVLGVELASDNQYAVQIS